MGAADLLASNILNKDSPERSGRTERTLKREQLLNEEHGVKTVMQQRPAIVPQFETVDDGLDDAARKEIEALMSKTPTPGAQQSLRN